MTLIISQIHWSIICYVFVWSLLYQDITETGFTAMCFNLLVIFTVYFLKLIYRYLIWLNISIGLKFLACLYPNCFSDWTKRRGNSFAYFARRKIKAFDSLPLTGTEKTTRQILWRNFLCGINSRMIHDIIFEGLFQLAYLRYGFYNNHLKSHFSVINIFICVICVVWQKNEITARRLKSRDFRYEELIRY